MFGYIQQELNTENKKKILIETTAKRHIKYIKKFQYSCNMSLKEKN